MKPSAHMALVSLLIFSFAGCAYQAPKDINSSFYSPPVGSTLTLHRPVTIPANDTQVHIQNGQLINSFRELDAYYPNCNFEIRERAEVERTVQPDSFIISRVVRDTENVMLHTPVLIASASGNGAPGVDYITIMDLYSPRQPSVMRMSCQHWEDPSDSYHLSIKQIRKTLGDLFTLTLADG